MSVLIKGMGMPKCCDECPLGEYEDSEWFSCSLMDMDYRHMAQCDRLDDCPLVALPENHGRLIDESIILEMIRKSMGIKDLSFLYNVENSIVNKIYQAPTVIEAERNK